MNLESGKSFKLFRLFGINVRLHWMWFLVAAYEFTQRQGGYESPIYNALEYLSLFLIVLMHEFGHALACRSVGGQADEIVLWPLGGVAYVSPPPRPGAHLWSIAAGPLVNVCLIPVIMALWAGLEAANSVQIPVDVYRLLARVRVINYGLLIFNMLPIYPLDGGQILRSLLWFPLGAARSLKVSSLLGLLGGAGVIALAVWAQSLWIGVIAFFMLTRCWAAFQTAGKLAVRESAARRPGFACPECHALPLEGGFWRCGFCSRQFDPFARNGTCPNCDKTFLATSCPECGTQSPLEDWRTTGAGVPPPLLR